jgi:hypothetical protein
MAVAHIAPPARSVTPAMKSTVSARVRIQLLRMVRLEYWETARWRLRRSVTSRPYPTAARCSLLLTVLISKPVALIAMMFPNEKNGMRVKPLVVSKEAAQRSGGLPTLIPFR